MTLAYVGECCPSSDACSLVDGGEEAESTLVCDSDGVTHDDECTLDAHICLVERRDARLVRYVHDGTRAHGLL